MSDVVLREGKSQDVVGGVFERNGDVSRVVQMLYREERMSVRGRVRGGGEGSQVLLVGPVGSVPK